MAHYGGGAASHGEETREKGAMPSQSESCRARRGAEHLRLLRRLSGRGGGGSHRLLQLPPDPHYLLLRQGPRGALRFDQPRRLTPACCQTPPSSGDGPAVRIAVRVTLRVGGRMGDARAALSIKYTVNYSDGGRGDDGHSAPAPAAAPPLPPPPPA